MNRRGTFGLSFIGESEVKTFLVLIAGAMILSSCARTTSNQHFSSRDVGSSAALEKPVGQQATIEKSTPSLEHAGETTHG